MKRFGKSVLKPLALMILIVFFSLQLWGPSGNTGIYAEEPQAFESPLSDIQICSAGQGQMSYDGVFWYCPDAVQVQLTVRNEPIGIAAVYYTCVVDGVGWRYQLPVQSIDQPDTYSPEVYDTGGIPEDPAEWVIQTDSDGKTIYMSRSMILSGERDMLVQLGFTDLHGNYYCSQKQVIFTKTQQPEPDYPDAELPGDEPSPAEEWETEPEPESTEEMTEAETVPEPETAEEMTEAETLPEPESAEEMTEAEAVPEPETAEEMTEAETLSEPESAEEMTEAETVPMPEYESAEEESEEASESAVDEETASEPPAYEETESEGTLEEPAADLEIAAEAATDSEPEETETEPQSVTEEVTAPATEEISEEEVLQEEAAGAFAEDLPSDNSEGVPEESSEPAAEEIPDEESAPEVSSEESTEPDTFPEEPSNPDTFPEEPLNPDTLPGEGSETVTNEPSEAETEDISDAPEEQMPEEGTQAAPEAAEELYEEPASEYYESYEEPYYEPYYEPVYQPVYQEVITYYDPVPQIRQDSSAGSELYRETQPEEESEKESETDREAEKMDSDEQSGQDPEKESETGTIKPENTETESSRKGELKEQKPVNIEGSTYDLTGIEQVNGQYCREAQDLVITETNMDKLLDDSILVTVSRNGETFELERDVDYTCKLTGNSEERRQYQYVIHKEVFQEEGNYRVFLSSEDESGNISSNESKGAPISFSIDVTEPLIISVGAEPEQEQQGYRELTIRDNVRLSGVDIYLGEEKVPYETDGELYSFTIPEGMEEEEIRVVASDAAGNSYERMLQNRVTSGTAGLKKKPGNSLPLVVTAAVFPAAGAVLLLHRRKKRRRD